MTNPFREHIESLCRESKDKLQREHMEFVSNALADMLFKQPEPKPEYPVSSPWKGL